MSYSGYKCTPHELFMLRYLASNTALMMKVLQVVDGVNEVIRIETIDAAQSRQSDHQLHSDIKATK